MKLYSKKQQWKQILFSVGLVIVVAVVWLTSLVVSNVKKAELEKIQLWSQAIKKKAELVRLTNEAFNELAQNERNKVLLWARATKEFQKSLTDFGLALEIIQNNNNIPLILTDKKGAYISHKNIPLLDELKLELRQNTIDTLCFKWSKQNKPIEFNYYQDRIQKIYYSNSAKYFQLQVSRDSLLNAFSNQLMNNIAQLPVVFWSNEGDSLIASNVINNMTSKVESENLILEMSVENDPIEILLEPKRSGNIYFNNSEILFQLKYFPFVTLLIIAFFLLVSYLSFSSFRKAEQNQVWAGMAKETAHQLGTPLSSLQGWIEILRSNGKANEEAFLEMEKDVKRLTIVSDRFSKIGSKVETEPTDIIKFFKNHLEYMQKRMPKTVEVFSTYPSYDMKANINTPLFSWVIENVMKNAADAMEGQGKIFFSIKANSNDIIINMQDSGKGIPSAMQKTIFEPGYTTKERGWGLGLSLAKRIVEGQHNGKIYVKSSKKDVGTTIELIIPSL
mgnify:CR=1 FL=1